VDRDLDEDDILRTWRAKISLEDVLDDGRRNKRFDKLESIGGCVVQLTVFMEVAPEGTIDAPKGVGVIQLAGDMCFELVHGLSLLLEAALHVTLIDDAGAERRWNVDRRGHEIFLGYVEILNR